MLKKKGGAGFKPKAPVRRNAPGPSSQGPDRQASKTPAPSNSQQPTPTPTLSQTPAVEHNTPAPVANNAPTAPTTEPAGAPPTPADSQGLPTVETPTATRDVPEKTYGVSQSSTTARIESGEAQPQNVARVAGLEGNRRVTRSGASATSTSTQPTSSGQTATTIILSDTVTPATVPTTQPAPTPKAATHQRVPLPTAAPITTPRVSEPATPSATYQPSSSAPITTVPTGAAQAEPSVVPRQTGTPPVEDPAALQQSIEVAGDAESSQPSAAPPKPKRAPRKRKPAAGATEIGGDAEPAPAAKKPRTRKKAVAPVEEEDAEAGESSQPPVPKPRTRKPRATRESQSSGEGVEGAETEITTTKKKGGFRPRSPTPEDAEEKEVDQRQVKMGDLVKDLRIGKKFSRHDELLERERIRKAKAKMGIPSATADADAGTTPVPPGSKAGTPAPGQENGESSSSAPKPLADGAPQFQIIDGQIVVNQSTLQFDRHAAAAREAGDLEEEIEDDFTHRTTSNTYSKKIQKPNHWTDIETETFYRGLRMWGTDFALLCRMFPGKNRRHIKLKFNREERAHPGRVNDALVGRKTVQIDLEEYKSHTGLEYKSVEAIEAEQARVEEEFEAEQRRAEEEAGEEARRKKEELFGKKEELEKKGKRGRRKREMGMGLGG